MEAATFVNFIWFRMGTSLRHAKPSEELCEEMADLATVFSGLLKKNAEAFDWHIRLDGFAPFRLTFHHLRQTVATVFFHPHADQVGAPDALMLLINGLEGADDIAVVKSAVHLPPDLWQLVGRTPKPVAVAAFAVNGRIREPATITVMQAIANVYFNTFGTNAIDRPGKRP